MLSQNKKQRKKVSLNQASIAVCLFAALAAWFALPRIFNNYDTPTNTEADALEVTHKSTTSPFKAEGAYPVAVMIDNAPEARIYHAGLSRAAVVYETLAEGGATRLMSVFAGAPDASRIGPVRSTRPYFAELAAGWHALYMHAGGSPEALALIPKIAVIDLNEISGLGPRYFWRDAAIARPHNLFSEGALIGLGIADFEPGETPEQSMAWQYASVLDIPEAPEAYSLYIDFTEGITYDSSFVYDEESHTYARSQSGLAHRDVEANSQLAPSTVVIQRVGAEGYYPSGYGRVIINVEGEGNALFFRDGRVYSGIWKKESVNAQTEWFLDSGEQFQFAPGQIWIVIVPGDRNVNYQ